MLFAIIELVDIRQGQEYSNITLFVVSENKILFRFHLKNQRICLISISKNIVT